MERLQFITREKIGFTHLDALRKACDAGVKWIQLRVKEQSQGQILELALEAKRITDAAGAKLTINDHANIAINTGSYGLHLGKEDMPLNKAKQLAKSNLVIGGTANTLEDIIKLAGWDADYIGLGPYRFTTTKKQLSPVLGLKGYEQIMNACSRMNIRVPVMAIGGIGLADIGALMQTGIYGIAVSSLIADAPDAKKEVEKINEEIRSNVNGEYVKDSR